MKKIDIEKSLAEAKCPENKLSIVRAVVRYTFPLQNEVDITISNSLKFAKTLGNINIDNKLKIELLRVCLAVAMKKYGISKEIRQIMLFSPEITTKIEVLLLYKRAIMSEI